MLQAESAGSSGEATLLEADRLDRSEDSGQELNWGTDGVWRGRGGRPARVREDLALDD